MTQTQQINLASAMTCVQKKIKNATVCIGLILKNRGNLTKPLLFTTNYMSINIYNNRCTDYKNVPIMVYLVKVYLISKGRVMFPMHFFQAVFFLLSLL